MLALVLDSATPAVTAAVVRVAVDAVVVEAVRRTVDARAHGELLAPEVAEVLAEAGAGVTDLAAIVAGTGPGPFTGLRVGLVTAASMGQALGVPTYGVCSLDAIGAAAPSGQRTLVATDARRREVYWAVYGPHGERLTEPAVDSPAAVRKHARELDVAVAVGEGATRYGDQLGVKVLDEPQYPSVEAFAALAANRVRLGAPSEPLTPRYLRRPDAVAAASRKPVLP